MNRIITLIFLFFSTLSFSQGLVENELTTNQTIVVKYNELKSTLRAPSVNDTISLGSKGILDDFSNAGPYPDTSIWLDNKVFINRTFAKAPITLGVATFDGLDYNGYPYDFTAGPATSAVADYLTSKPIHLNKPVSDSIYFSFYYQPQGNGNAPESSDSLVVQFKRSSGWKNVWAKKGTTLAINDSSWDLVMIPITDTAYLKDGFQFRFMNRATISGNTDHWNIDYVYLNKIRNKNDTTFEDVSFVYNTPPLITKYSAMPWKQYDTTDMKVVYASTIRNNHTVTKNASFTQRIFDGLGTQVSTTYFGGAYNVDPFSMIGYLNYPSFTLDTIGYTIPLQTTASRYTIESAINSTPDFDRSNDTVRYTQDLTNYFAYDDGTAENSFGMSTISGQLAERFVLNVADSLQFIDIYFNPFLTNASIYSFNLKVWVDASGSPGPAIYTSSAALNPAYSGVTYNQFIRYKLDAPLYLNPGTFYVGFLQNTNQFLNVGVDKNTDSQSNVFYNVTGSWLTSPFFGSVMMHPVFGAASEFSGINEDLNKKELAFSVYPNPAQDQLFLKFDKSFENQKIEYAIFDIYGKVVMNTDTYSGVIDIASLSSGIYFVRVNSQKSSATAKFIKIQ